MHKWCKYNNTYTLYIPSLTFRWKVLCLETSNTFSQIKNCLDKWNGNLNKVKKMKKRSQVIQKMNFLSSPTGVELPCLYKNI